ncbi:porin [Methylophilus glucosoxydans]|uniref:Porin n=1 Tax=Methylophilus glucosoxydans TaxID=752553 RepID=A0ABW3GDM5_9PROT|nr:porin [Methylophilus sp. 13]MBF5040488.1 porin [Methylophilus sp. 13]
MNTKLNVAVAAALFAAATGAQAGITIPAGDWTLDIGGVVNAYYTHTSFSGDDSAAGEYQNGDSVANITTGLLPNYLSVSGKTRQNDLDVGFTISINPGASTTAAGKQSSQQENRQAFLTFGDASWGSIKLGKDLGIYASDAILNDQTLLGVGSAAGSLAGNTTTLGRIGRGYMYADWKAQVAYTSPNWNGFQFTAGLTQGWNALAGTGTNSVGSTDRAGSQTAYEGKASYEWTGDVAGKVWVSAISQKVDGLGTAAVAATVSNVNGVVTAVPAVAAQNFGNERAYAWDLGTSLKIADFGLVGYYGQGKGIGQTVQFLNGFDRNGKRRDSDQWYVQGSYTIPGVGTKLAASYGESTLDGNGVDSFSDIKANMWVVGAYHPLTKHLNLVAEYSQAKDEVNNRTAADTDLKAKTVSLGAILFF